MIILNYEYIYLLFLGLVAFISNILEWKNRTNNIAILIILLFLLAIINMMDFLILDAGLIPGADSLMSFIKAIDFIAVLYLLIREITRKNPVI